MKKIDILSNLKSFTMTFFAIILFVFGSSVLIAQTTAVTDYVGGTNPSASDPSGRWRCCRRSDRLHSHPKDHEVAFDENRCSSGMYFCKMMTAAYSRITKMTIIKLFENYLSPRSL